MRDAQGCLKLVDEKLPSLMRRCRIKHPLYKPFPFLPLKVLPLQCPFFFVTEILSLSCYFTFLYMGSVICSNSGQFICSSSSLALLRYSSISIPASTAMKKMIIVAGIAPESGSVADIVTTEYTVRADNKIANITNITTKIIEAMLVRFG